MSLLDILDITLDKKLKYDNARIKEKIKNKSSVILKKTKERVLKDYLIKELQIEI